MSSLYVGLPGVVCVSMYVDPLVCIWDLQPNADSERQNARVCLGRDSTALAGLPFAIVL